MDAPGFHKDRTRQDVHQDVSERYEHYAAEHEDDESDVENSPRDVDVVTPLASDQLMVDEDVGMHGDHHFTSSIIEEAVEDEDRSRSREAHGRLVAPNIAPVSWEGYFTSHGPRSSPVSRRGFICHNSSNPSSSGSLQALSENETINTIQPSIRRAVSTKSNPGPARMRSTSQSKTPSLSQPGSKRPSYSDHPVYPDQSYASLQAPVVGTRPHPVLRARSSHPAQNLLYNEVSRGHKHAMNSGVRTADNTPMSSPGLFSPLSVKQSSDSQPGSPQLHHLQAPKETHTAEIEHDVYSGNKFINNYEVMGELGRGEHGKVKLGRNIERNSHLVAIKIVPRYSAKRRLGKLGAPEDRTKREVAILKKARHPNVVSLLEVIDDPNKNKVYLILEYVDKGEIKWRKHGVKEILAISNQRFEQEKLGVNITIDPSDRDLHIVHLASVRHERLEQMRRHNAGLSSVPNWSLEYAGETDDEGDAFDLSRSLSRQFSHLSTPMRGNSGDDYNSQTSEPSLSGSMYGAYMPDAYRNRKFSIAGSAISHMSSEMNFEQDDDQRSFVPALTLEEARRSFQDTLLGLEFLHFIGIIHRDIKPANLLVSSSGTVKISDFGVSYLGRPVAEEEASKSHEHEASPLDNEKELARSVGTPAFWAPELCYENTDMFADKKEPKITGALDLWALGITLYCMIYARLPFYHNETMGIHEAVCTAEVFCPTTRLVPVDTTSSEPISRPLQPINSNKRLDYELKFEHVPETIRDLITKLLTKDPAHRITIAEAKEHPWVAEGMADPQGFLKNPEMAKESKKKILEMSDKEIDRAVVKRNFIDKISTTAGRIMGSLLGRKDNRKRASTGVSSGGSSSESLYSPAGSTTSTVGKADRTREPRRASLRGDELLQALKASRDPNEHHPLAQSQTASPDSQEASRPSSPGYFDHSNKAASAGATPGTEFERQGRPRGPNRAISALSTADSVKTVRATQPQRSQMFDFMENTNSTNTEPSIRSRMEGLWEATTKSLDHLTSNDRQSTIRSRSNSRTSSEHDGHSGPSLAVSNTYAAGAIQTPNALRAVDATNEDRSHVSSPKDVDVTRHSLFRVPSSDPLAFEQAQQMNQRRQIQEALSRAEDAANKHITEPADEPCPPSPDDLTFVQRSRFNSAQLSPSGLPSASDPTAASASTIASSLDGYGNSSVSQSISNPSIGILSNSSSPPGDNFLLDEYKQHHDGHAEHGEMSSDIMRTADTVTFHGRPTTPTATGKTLQAQQEYYEHDDYDDESDSSDEEGIVMGSMRRS